jgi:class 3 adenylate cyclase
MNKQLALIRLGQINDYYDGHTLCIRIDDVEIPCKNTIIGIRKKANEEINKQFTLIRLGQIDDYYDGHIICIAIDDVEIPCKITMIGMRKTANEEMNRYVVILENESLVLKYQTEVEQMKQKTDELFSEILPKEIHYLFNQNEEDVVFTVESASIIFIDIARFCDYISSLPPNLTMEFLSKVFGAYDEVMKKYTLMTKIKSIGDAYLAVSGLFSPNDPHQSHAEQIVSFGLDCIQVFERINLGLNAQLSIRIGIHCGSLITGILRNNNLAFEVVGNAISIVSKLIRTCPQGKVLISQDIYDLISEEEKFKIEKRGEISLRGNIALRSYLVSSGEIKVESLIDNH